MAVALPVSSVAQLPSPVVGHGAADVSAMRMYLERVKGRANGAWPTGLSTQAVARMLTKIVPRVGTKAASSKDVKEFCLNCTAEDLRVKLHAAGLRDQTQLVADLIHRDRDLIEQRDLIHRDLLRRSNPTNVPAAAPVAAAPVEPVETTAHRIVAEGTTSKKPKFAPAPVQPVPEAAAPAAGASGGGVAVATQALPPPASLADYVRDYRHCSLCGDRVVVLSPMLVDEKRLCNDCYARVGSDVSFGPIRQVEVQVTDERGRHKTVALTLAAVDGHAAQKEERLTALVQLWEAQRISTDRSAQVVRGGRVQVPFPRDWKQQDAVARTAFLREFNEHMLPYFELYTEMGDLVFQLLEEQRPRARTAYLTLYPGESSDFVWYGVEIVYVIAPAPLQGWHDDDVKAREMQVAIFCTPTHQATWHYCYDGDGVAFLRGLRQRVLGNKGVLDEAVFEAALRRNGDLGAVTAANSSEELKKVVTRPMFPAGLKMEAGCMTALGDGAVVHAGPALDARAEPVRVFVAAQCAPSAKFDAAFCDDEPAQIDGWVKMLELGLDTSARSMTHVQQMRFDTFNELRGVTAWASLAKRTESDVRKVLNPLCKPQPNEQAARRTATVSTPSGFTVCDGWTAPAFKHAHTYTFFGGYYVIWGHTGHGYAIEVIWMVDCPDEGVVVKPIAPDNWEEFCVKKGQVIKVVPGARARWLSLGKGPCTKHYAYYDKDGREVEAAGAAEGTYEIQCDVCKADCWRESYKLAHADVLARHMPGPDVCVKCFLALTKSNSLIASDKAERLACGRAWREPLDPQVAQAFCPPIQPSKADSATQKPRKSPRR